MERKVVWNNRPSTFLSKALKRISEESYQSAEIVERAVLSAIELGKSNPERFPRDKFKNSNDGSFRAFETHSFRVAYRFTKREIRILRIRHVKQEPKSY